MRQVLSVATIVMRAHRGASAVVGHVVWLAHGGVLTNAGTFLAWQWLNFIPDPRARRAFLGEAAYKYLYKYVGFASLEI